MQRGVLTKNRGVNRGGGGGGGEIEGEGGGKRVRLDEFTDEGSSREGGRGGNNSLIFKKSEQLTKLKELGGYGGEQMAKIGPGKEGGEKKHLTF